MKAHDTGDLLEALEVGRGDLVSLVGGGGKTTCLYRLVEALTSAGLRAAAATTAKIAVPEAVAPVTLLCAEVWEELLDALKNWPWGGPPPVLGARVLAAGKVGGIPPEWCGRLLASGWVDALVVEADGAARKPVKAPEAWEPVVPSGTTRLVPVLGLSCAGRPLHEDVAFRVEQIASVTGLGAGEPLTADALAELLTSPRGLLKGKPGGARVSVLLNQADLPGALDAGRSIAAAALERSEALDRVVISALGSPGFPLEVWTR